MLKLIFSEATEARLRNGQDSYADDHKINQSTSKQRQNTLKNVIFECRCLLNYNFSEWLLIV